MLIGGIRGVVRHLLLLLCGIVLVDGFLVAWEFHAVLCATTDLRDDEFLRLLLVVEVRGLGRILLLVLLMMLIVYLLLMHQSPLLMIRALLVTIRGTLFRWIHSLPFLMLLHHHVRSTGTPGGTGLLCLSIGALRGAHLGC